MRRLLTLLPVLALTLCILTGCGRYASALLGRPRRQPARAHIDAPVRGKTTANENEPGRSAKADERERAREESVRRLAEAREKKQAQAQAIRDALDIRVDIDTTLCFVDFTAGQSVSNQTINKTTAAVSPGGTARFEVAAMNIGTAPISNIYCLLEPNEYLQVPRDIGSEYDAYRKRVATWQSTGLPLVRQKYVRGSVFGNPVFVTTVNPKDDPHYEYDTKTVDLSGLCLQLSPNAPQGTDIPVQLYLRINGCKFPLPPFTIQVKHIE